jgi:hypothetical protein
LLYRYPGQKPLFWISKCRINASTSPANLSN